MNKLSPKRTLSEQMMYALRHHLRVPVTALMIGCNLAWTLQSNGEVLIKTNSGANTYLTTVLPTAGTVQGTDPTASDILSFRNDITAATTFRLMNMVNGVLNVQGLQVINPAGAITIQNNAGQNQTLSIGSAGIDLSMATNNLILNNSGNTMGVLLQNAQAATWSVASGRTLQVTSNISGSATGLTINPGINGLGGTVNLGGSNTFSGATTVNNSALILDYTNAANRLDSASALNLNRGTVTAQGGATHTQAVAGLNLGSGMSQLLRGGTTASLNVGAITRSAPLNGMLNVGSTGFVSTSAANTSGILGGWAVVINGTTSGDWATVTGGVITNGVAYTDRGATWTNPLVGDNVRITASSSGIGAVSFNSLKFTGAQTLTQTAGTTMNIVSGGILKNDNNASTITGGSLTAGGTSNTTPDALYIWQNQNKLTIASAIVNNGSDVVHLNKAGAGELELSSGTSNYTGVTTVANGRLTITNPNAINKAGNIELYGNSGADNTGSLQWNTATAATITGNIIGAAGNDSNRHALRKLTSGVLTLTPSSANTYSGSTLIDAGSLQAGKVNAFSPNSRVQFANVANAVLNLANFNNTVRGLAGGGATGGNVSLGTATLTLASLANDALSYAGVISGTGGVTKTGGGQQTFSANQTFSGPLVVDEGTLSTAGLASTNVTVQAGGVLLAGNLVSATTIAVNGNGSLQLKPGGSLAATPAVVLNGNGASLQLNNGVNQTFSSFSSSAGSRLLMGAGSSASSVTLGAGVSQLDGVIAMSSSQGNGLGSVIINKAGSTTLTLSGGNAYNGETTVNGGGKLAISPTATVEVLPDTTALTLNDSGLVLNNRSETIGSLAGNGTVELGAGTLTVGGNNQSTVYSGVISGTGSLIKAGVGTLALTGGNTFTGGLNIQGGTVNLGRLGGNTLASTLPVQVQGMDARLLVSTNQTLSALNAGPNTKVEVAANATLTVNQGAGTQTIIAADGDTDTRVIRLRNPALASTLRPGMRVRWSGSESQIPDGAYITQVLSDGQILLNVTPVNGDFTNKDLIFESVSEVTGTLEGAGDFVKSGTGTMVLAANHTLSGTIKVDEGRLQVGGINANGRNWLQDIIGNQATLDFSTTRATALDFVNNAATYAPFERIGALSGGFYGTDAASTTTINLSGGATHTTLAVGGNNATTTYKGYINGGATTALVKEGTGKMTWQIDTASPTAMSGTVRVDGGELAITGAAGLNPLVRVVTSNKPGAVLSFSPENIAAAQSVSNLSGGGRGAVTSFANGSLGALAGNYLGDTGGEIRLVDLTPDNGILPQFVVDNTTANAVMRYGGAITGQGGLTKRGPNTLELFGNSTYTGVTTVVVGQAADNTTSTLRLGAYGLSSGVGTLAAAGFGSLPSTTRLELLGFSTNRNAAFDLNGASQTVSSLISDTVGGTSTVFLRGGELTINALGSAATGNFTGTFSEYGTINVLATQGTEGWTLSGDSNLTQRGFLNISGGKVTLNRVGGSLGDAVHVALNGGSLAVRETDTIGSLSGNGSVSVSPGKFLTLSSAPSGGVAEKPWSGQISGDGGLALAAGASIRITSAQAYNGNTVVNSGAALYLDYGATSPNLIPANSTLRLNGGNIFLSGTSGQDVATAVLGSGNTVFSAALPASPNGPTALLKIGTLTRDVSALPNSEDPGSGGGVLQVRGASLAVNNPANGSGILGGYATYHAVDINGNPVVSWAVPNGTNAVTGLPGSSYSSAYGVNIHTDLTGENTLVPKFGDMESLRFNTQAPVDLLIGGISGNEDTTILSGGILVTPSVGSNNVRITGFGDGATLRGGAGTPTQRVRSELIIHQHNTRGTLTIDAKIGDFNNASRLTKTGQGTLILTRENTYSGQTSILAGVLELATSVSDPSVSGSLGNVLGNLAIQNHGYLSINRFGSSDVYEINNNIVGTGILRKKNSGTVILRGSNSNYTGATQILGGKLSVAAGNALGSTAGLTTVFPQGTLEIRGTTSPEPVVLQGGTLTSAIGPSTLSGPVVITQNSTVSSPSAVNAEMNLSGSVTTFAGAVLNIAGGTPQSPGRVTLSSSLNQIDRVSIAPNASLQIGSNTTGSLGRGTLIETAAGSTFITNTSNAHMVFNSVMTGAGNYVHARQLGYIVGDNSYTGETIVGGNGIVGVANFPAELRVGADTYTGALGSGKIIIQATTSTSSIFTGSSSILRYALNKSSILSNNIDINPANEGQNVKNAFFIRAGLGSMTLTGTITAGDHSSGNLLQRASLQSEAGGKLVISGVINNGLNNQMNIVNNGFVVFANNDPAFNQELWGSITSGNHTTFKSAGTITLRGINTNNGISYVKRGAVVVDNSSKLGLHDDLDLYVARGATLEFNSMDTVGLVSSLSGGTIRINSGVTLTMNDSATSANYGLITGDGALALSADGGPAWYGLFGENNFSGGVTIGSSNQQTTVRVDSLPNSGLPSSLGMGSSVVLGVAGGTNDTRLEYTGLGESTDRSISLTGGVSTFRIAGSGRGALILDGPINVTETGNKTLHLHGQTVGNTINGVINEKPSSGSSVLSLVVNSAAANNDMYGAGRWILTNGGNNFSGNVTVNMGVLELAGDLGDGTGATSVFGNLGVDREIDLGTANFDGRRFDVFSGGDGLGGAGGAPNFGALLFNDPSPGIASFSSKIKFFQKFSNSTNPGSGELINNGNKVVKFAGAFASGSTTGSDGSRNWILDGTNTGDNTISGVISDSAATGTGHVVGVLKEGTGRWILSGANTYEGTTTVNRGILEITGGVAIHDNGLINLGNAGSDGSASGDTIFRVLQSEVIGGFIGTAGTRIEIAGNQLLTLRGATPASAYNGTIAGDGGLVRTNSDGTTRELTLTGLNTYTGPTKIVTTPISGPVNRINVYFMANGGSASGIGAASSAASNLVFDNGSNGGGLRWNGTGEQSTDRLFTLGAGTGAGTIWSDGQFFGDNATSLSFTNPGAIAFLANNTAQTLTLRGTSLSENIFAPLLSNNGTGATSLIKNDAGMWVLTNANTYTGGTRILAGTLAVTNSSALGSADVRIEGGGGTGLQLRGGIAISNNVIATVGDAGLASASGNNSLSGNVTFAGSFRLGVSEGSTLNILGDLKGSVGSGRLAIYDRGTLILSGASDNFGATSISGGTTILNYDTGANGKNVSKFSDSSALELGFSGTVANAGITTGLGAESDVNGQTYQPTYAGATVVLSGGSHPEVVGSLLLNNGASRILRTSGTSTLNVNGITRNIGNGVNDYGTIDFGGAGFVITSSTNTSGGILGANGAFATVDQTNWAVAGASGTAISALATYAANDFGANKNTDITQASVSAAANATTHTIRFNTNNGGTTTLNLGGALQLETGGILVTKNVTDDVVITGTGGIIRRSAATGNLDTIVHHHGTGTLSINAVIANNTTATNQAFTKAGSGLVVLNGTNTFGGRVSIQQGILQVGDGTAATSTARLGNGGNPLTMSDGATLLFNVANGGGTEFVLGAMSGGGLLRLAPGNQSILTLASDNVNWVGDILVEGGTLRIRGSSNALGNVRGTTVIRSGARLDINGASGLTFNERMVLEDGALFTVTNNGATNSSATMSGHLTLQNTTAAGLAFNVGASQTLTLSGMLKGDNGFTKTGNGILNISGNQYQDLMAGATHGTGTPNANPALKGQVIIEAGEVRLGNPRALGATGAGNETIVRSGASLDLRGQALNFFDDPDPFREIIQISGSGSNGTGALKNSSGLGTVSTIRFDGNATLSGGGYSNGYANSSSRLVLAAYDTNPNTSSTAASALWNGNFDRVDAVIDGRNADLTILGGTVAQDGAGANVTFRDPNFLSALNSINIREGIFRIDEEAGVTTAYNGLHASNITNGITIGYGGASLADNTNASLGVGPNVGSRLNFYRSHDTIHTVKITMDGVLAKQNGGANYIDLGTDTTIPNPRTYLNGEIVLTGDADRNIFHIDASSGQLSVGEQGNMTGVIQSKLIIGGQITGSGGLTKTGVRELRLTNNNTFTGAVNVLRSGTAAMAWQDNTVTINGVNYQTYGDAEGWGEWGLTLSGVNGAISQTQSVNLQRRGLIVLDNTNRLNQTNQVAGGNNNDRIYDGADINFNHGWLKIIGGTENNTEQLATQNGAKLNVLSGSNIIDLMPTDNTKSMTLRIGEITRSPGSLLLFNNLASSSKFSTDSGPGSVRILLDGIGTLQQSGAGTTNGQADRKIVIGMFGGITPHQYQSDLRSLSFNNGGVSDYLNQIRNMQWIASSHFMTYDGNVLRPLDDSEYYMPTDGLLDAAAGKNVNLSDPYTIMRKDVSINALRFGVLADNNGDGLTGTRLNSMTSITDTIDAHSLQLYVDGALTIDSGMISSAYYTTGNVSSLSTLIVGGTLNFGTREAIILNQNATLRSSDGAVPTGNLEIRSSIAGSGGLLKSGFGTVVLDGRNTYTGTTTVSNGVLFLRNGRNALGAGGEGNGAVVEGNGNLYSGNGIQVGAPGAYETILVKALQGNQQVMRTDSDLTNWFANLVIDNVDAAGQVLFTPIVRAEGTATSIINGNIYGGASAVTNDVAAIDPRIVQFDSSGNNTFIFRGQFGDRGDASGNAIPVADRISTLPTQAGVRTNENEVLRVNLNGASGETNYVMEKQYNAAGRLTVVAGNLLVTYDPNDPTRDGNGFYTDTALSKIPNADSTTNSFAVNGGTGFQGFILGTTSNNTSSLLLTKPGQHFNMGAWTATGSGIKFVGGLNETGEVRFGGTTATNTLTIGGTALRFYAAAGGSVVFDHRITGSPGTAPNNIGVMKVGRGTVTLRNSANTTAGDSNFQVSGGKLILDHSGQNVALVGGGSSGNAIFSGGVVHALSNLAAATTVGYALTSNTNNVLQIQNGTTEIIAEGRGTRTMTVNMGNTNANSNRANLTRAIGGALNMVEAITGNGNGVITLNFNNFTNALLKNRAITWATYSNTPREALDFAMVDAGAPVANRVKAYNRLASEYVNDVAAWADRMNVSENGGAGFFGTLASNRALNTLRFDSMADSVVTLASGVTLSLSGDGGAGGLLVSSNTGSSNKTITGGSISGSGSAPEIVVHQYGKGKLTIASNIVGDTDLTIAGPSTTSPENFGTTGVVKLTGNNTYTGQTFVNGAVLEFGSMSALGTSPTTFTNNHLTLNGGTLRWTGGVASLGNRGVMLQGDGGVFDIANASGNLVIGAGLTVGSGLNSQEIFRGDLVKTGAGALTLLGTHASFQGLMDVRQGSLVLVSDVGNAGAGTVSVLGSNRSWADGTIMRQGTNLQVFLGNANNSGDWNIEEFFTFEGNNTFSYGGLLDINANLASDGVLSGSQFNMGNRRPLNLNGVMDIKGTTTFDVLTSSILRLNNNTGYLTGSGDIVKDGAGRMEFRANVPDWKGSLVIKQGTVWAANQADVIGTGYASGKTITLGDSERTGLAEFMIYNPDSIQGWIFDINHDINVTYNPLQTKRLGIESTANDAVTAYNGNITLNDNLVLIMRDSVNMPVGGEQFYVQFNGRLKDGATTSGNILVQTDETSGTANDAISARTYGYAMLNGDNSAWTGDITISNNAVYNHDSTSILRLGNAKALTAANDVTMNFNSILQAGGQNVSIGNLTTLGGTGAFFGSSGSMSSSANGSSEIIENASATPGVLTITQSTPSTYEAVWDAFFRDGTLNSQFFAPGANVLQPSASLGVTKAGNGWATLSLDNDYTGPTVVQQGILQVGRNGIGDTGKSPSISNPNMMTTVMNGATIAGSGIVQGKLTIQSGGILSTGDQAGKAIGTLFVSGDMMLASGSQALMQLRNATYNNPGALTASDENYSFWRNGVLTDEFSSGLNSMVTGSQHDMLTASGTINWAPGAKIMVQNDGYTPKAGDIFRLFKGAGYLGSVNVGPVLRKGGDDLTIPNLDLILFALGGNLMWDTSLFNSAGILMVVEADTAIEGIPAPAFSQGPIANRDLSERLAPGTSVTISALAATPGKPDVPVVYQWYLEESAIPGATSSSYTFEANFATKGKYSVSASNAGGTTIHPDKLEVLVDDVPDITTQPSSATVAPGSNHTFGVQSRGQAPFTYQWYKNGSAIQGATGQFYSLINVQEADEGNYRVVVTNGNGSDESDIAVLDVIDEITSVVASVTPVDAYLGQEIRFSVVHNGEGDITYQWRRNGSNISGATSATYVIPGATAAADGSYTVAVTNEIDTKVSNAVTLSLQNPVVTIVTPPQSRTLLSGQSLDLKVVARGLPTLRYAWKKNNAVLANVFTADISKLNENGTGAALTDGGTYTVEVSNAQSKASTIANPAEIVVVDSTTRYLPVGDKGVATLTPVIAAGPKTPLSYKWVRINTRTVTGPGPDMMEGTEDDTSYEEETETELVSGSGAGQASVKAYKITGVTAVANNGFYRLKVTGPDGVTVTGNQYELRVFTDLPAFRDASFAFDTALIGRDYRFVVPVERDDTTRWPDKITAAGLPPGLKIDPISGVITGKPTATKVGGYKVTITLANKFGKVSFTGTLNVLDLNQTVPGTWVGVVGRNAALGDNLGGRVDLTVTSKATFTGKLLLGGTTYSFAGPLNVNAVPYTGSVYIKRAGNPAPDPLRLDFALDPVSNRFTSGLITDGVTNLSFTGWRQIYNKVLTASTYVGYYTMAVGLSDSDPLYTANPNGTKNVPLGAGYATFTVAADGKLTIAGKMPDGEGLTNAAFVGPDGELAVFQHMYKTLKPGGSLVGQFKIDDKVTLPALDPGNEDNTIEGSATWVRPASTKATDRTFKAGFGLPGTAVATPLTVVASGGRYVTPALGFSVLNIAEPAVGATPANNAEIDFINGGDLGYAYVSFGIPYVSKNPDVSVYVIKGSKVTVLSTTANETKTALTAAPKTGLLTGSFTAKDFSPIYPVKPEYITRSVKFQGVIIKETGENGQPSYVGVGYFLLPQLPKQNTETDKTTPIYSGRFVFEKL